MRTRLLTSLKSLAIVAVLITSSVPSKAQTSPALSIVSPANNTVVQSGQTIQVTVNATNFDLLTTESISGTNPLPTLPEQKAASTLTFSLTIPTGTPGGSYYLTAVGGLASGGIVYSDSILLTVSVAAPVSKLGVSNSPIYFVAPGNMTTLDVSATTSLGTVTITPRNLRFVSADPNIASVDLNGTVTAQAAGQTQISVMYESGNTSTSTVVPVQVSKTVLGDLNGDGRVDIDDVNILDEWLNTRANGPNDARDLNHDGVINALDARILVTLCTYPHCATHP